MSATVTILGRKAEDLLAFKIIMPLCVPFICLFHPVISKIFVALKWMIDSYQLVNSTNNLVQQPSSDTPPMTELEDSDPLFSRGFFFLLLISCLL